MLLSSFPASLVLNSTEILRDYMPDSNPDLGWKRYSPNCMATCREWQKCPLLFWFKLKANSQ